MTLIGLSSVVGNYSGTTPYTNSSNNYLNIELLYNSVGIHLLRYPYETQCVSYAPYHTGAELNAALLHAAVLNLFQKVSTLGPVYDNALKFPVLSAKHLRNKEFLQQYKLVLGEIHGRSKRSCETYYTTSKVTKSYGQGVTVSVYYPDDASIFVKFFPLQDPIDFILYICSSFGIWIGVSVLSFGEEDN